MAGDGGCHCGDIATTDPVGYQHYIPDSWSSSGDNPLGRFGNNRHLYHLCAPIVSDRRRWASFSSLASQIKMIFRSEVSGNLTLLS